MAFENKIAHLGFIQGVINRMGNNSFLIKGWVVALAAATFALFAEKANPYFLGIGIFSIISFWCLDAFFLHQEKMYRRLYEKVADNTESSENFTMDPRKYKKDVDCIFLNFISKSMISFYVPTVIVVVFVWCVAGPASSIFGCAVKSAG